MKISEVTLCNNDTPFFVLGNVIKHFAREIENGYKLGTRTAYYRGGLVIPNPDADDEDAFTYTEGEECLFLLDDIRSVCTYKVHCTDKDEDDDTEDTEEDENEDADVDSEDDDGCDLRVHD